MTKATRIAVDKELIKFAAMDRRDLSWSQRDNIRRAIRLDLVSAEYAVEREL
jgi:hypothetical protein